MYENIPAEPGCYLYKDKTGKVIYVGKARNLKKRVSSYFNRKLDKKTNNLVSQIRKTDFIVTSSEVEALILENNLIKKCQPKYNINLKDSKRYAYIEVTTEDFPRLLLARKKRDKGKFYGPFVSAAERDYVMEVLRKVFALRTCRKMPKKTCLRFHIKLCDAPCIGRISCAEYAKRMRKVEYVLKGQTHELIEELEDEMKKYSSEKMFENAIVVRNQINALTRMQERQLMELQKRYNEDVLNFTIKSGKVYLMLFNIYKGMLLNKQEFSFEYMEHFLEEFLVQYYSDNSERKELIMPIELDDGLKDYLKGKVIKVVKPKIGNKKKLLELVSKNIETTFFGNMQKIDELQKKLKLNDCPNVIECFDISHLSGTSTVGSMAQFRNGIPDKSNYRRFRIRSVKGIDDFAAIGEVVRRRYSRLKKESALMPDLVVIDGGKGQLSSALEQLRKLELKIPMISIAKRFEEIYFPGLAYPVRLKDRDKALLFLREIRDEAHRFAIKYNRLLRKKKLTPKCQKPPCEAGWHV